MGIEQSMKNAALMTGGLIAFRTNSPVQYGDKQKEYFAPQTKTLIQKVARFSNDFVLALVQTDVENDVWENAYIRMADVVSPSASITRRFDNYKAVLFADRTIQYIQPGTKIQCMGSVWLCTNPMNVSGGDGAGIVQRCNATWNHLDYYGNVLQEPIVVENQRANASDSDSQNSMYISKGYFNVTAQYNKWTAQLDTNSRLILGKGAYRITGYSDFHEEFTGDYDSRRILEFVMRYIEPNKAIDDLVNHVAEGKAFTWEVAVNGTVNAVAGQTAQFTASSTRKGQDVESTVENPISYTWTSSDEDVATVDANGVVNCIGAGEATITATLDQNTAYSNSLKLTVEEPGAESGVFFTSTVPDSLAAFDDVTITAAVFMDGEETEEAVAWSVEGANDGSFSYIAGPKAVTIYCYEYSSAPLTVTASYGEYSVSRQISLVGM